MVWFMCPSYQPDTVLAVCLGRCYAENFDRVKLAASKSLSGVDTSKLLVIHAPSSQLGLYGESSTISDMYSIARQAFDRGWKRLMVFDGLTYRQVCDKTRFGEVKSTTAIAMALIRERNYGAIAHAYHPQFRMQRLPWKVGFLSCVRQSVASSWLRDQVRRRGPLSLHEQTILSRGIIMRDPHEHLLEDLVPPRAAYDQRCDMLSRLQPHLPYELITRIAGYYGVERSVESMVDLDEIQRLFEANRPCDLLIIPLMRLDEPDLDAARKHIADLRCPVPWPSLQPLILPWRLATPVTRGEILRLAASIDQRIGQINRSRARPRKAFDQVVFLDPGPKSEVRRFTIIRFAHDPCGITIMCRDGIQQFFERQWQRLYGDDPWPGPGIRSATWPKLDPTNIEWSFHPNQSFPPTRLPWQMVEDKLFMRVMFDSSALKGSQIEEMEAKLHLEGDLDHLDRCDAILNATMNLRCNDDVDTRLNDDMETQQDERWEVRPSIESPSDDGDKGRLRRSCKTIQLIPRSWGLKLVKRRHYKRLYDLMVKDGLPTLTLANERILRTGEVTIVQPSAIRLPIPPVARLLHAKVMACDAYSFVRQFAPTDKSTHLISWAGAHGYKCFVQNVTPI